MALPIGSRLGSYEVAAQIGAGGMGEVYRARDPKLNRDVALKILPPEFALDADRLARFKREAHLLASLNHPNIAAIYGFEDSSEVHALVLELVEGPTLADRIAQGPLTLDEALPIARQIAEALEAAHEQGIVHRDLKPANIKIRADGTVKVLDFGLAKAIERAGEADGAGRAARNVSQSPTITTPAMTQMGVILGTAAYMSPEQAAGGHADKRSDLWAFGVVLLEMLTGRAVFTGATVSHVIAAVLKSNPDWTALPADTPASIRRLLRRCLEKDQKRRLDSASVARLEIDDALASPDGIVVAPAVSPRRVASIAIGTAIVGGIAAALVTWAVVRPGPDVIPTPSRFAISPPPAQAPWTGPFDRSIALTRDGRYLVYTTNPAAGPGGTLLVRPIDQLDVKPLPGVNRARAPFVSPDGQWIGFFQEAALELEKVPVGGGPAIPICAFSGAPRGASWGDDGSVVFATGDPTTGLWRVPSGGGTATVLTTPGPGEGDHLFPSVLPSGRGVVFTIAAQGQADRSDVAVFDSTTNQRRTLIRGGSQAEYVETGYLVYAAAGTLRAVRFDLAALQVVSDPVPVLDHVRMAPTGAANYAVSRTGTLVYLPGGPDAQPARSLMWVDRAGREELIKAPVRSYFMPRISPDGAHVALDIRDQDNDIWILDLARDAALRKLTNGPSSDTNPVWSVDGKYIIFTSNRSGPPHLHRQAVDGSGAAEPLPTGGNPQYATSVTPDGAGVIGHRDGASSFDVVLFPFSNPARPASSDKATSLDNAAHVQELVKTPYFDYNAELSPNGRYLAYQSNESGQFEVVVRPFPETSRGMWTISSGGGTRAVWAPNGKELFYRDATAAIVAVPVDTSGAKFTWGSSLKLFDGKDSGSVPDRNYDVAPDGRRFLMLKESADAKPSDIVVVLDWFEELKRLVPKN